MIVVDTNILAYFYLGGPYAGAAAALFEREPEWAVPHLWRSEMRNLLAGQVRRGSLGFGEALAIQSEAEMLVSGAEYEVNTPTVLALAHESGCTAFDCEFVALAQGLGTKLVTMDAELLRSFPETAVPLA